jgi:hypothetical protein
MTVLCLGSEADRTFLHTLAALKQAGIAFDALDLGQLACSGDLEVPLAAPGGATFTLHGRRSRLGDYRSVFFRTIGLASDAPDEKLSGRAAAQDAALARLLEVAPLLVVNPPRGDTSNAAKLFHAVSLASVAGWQVPRSCLTGRAEDARSFVASCEDSAIYKGASGVGTYARLFDPEVDDGRLPGLKECPVLFQERIAGPDVRVHALGERTVALLIESPGLDYRRGRGQRFQVIEAPPSIAMGCVALTRATGKPFLGIDFKIQRSTGDWFFLEANPQPGYDYFDRRADGKIARALVELLAGEVVTPESWRGRPLSHSEPPEASEGGPADLLESPLVRHPRVSARPRGEELVLCDDSGDREYVLNATARRVWELSDGRHTLASATLHIARAFGRSYAEVLPDVLGLVRGLREAGLLRSGADPVDPGADPEDDDDEVIEAARRFRDLIERGG